MKYALVNGEKKEATKRAKGKCSSCGSNLIAKCGEFKVNHWAHKGNRNCDPWWENETNYLGWIPSIPESSPAAKYNGYFHALVNFTNVFYVSLTL